MTITEFKQAIFKQAIKQDGNLKMSANPLGYIRNQICFCVREGSLNKDQAEKLDDWALSYAMIIISQQNRAKR